MTNDDRWTVEALLGAFDEDLRRTRGVCEGTRGNYTGHVRAFLATVSAHGAVDPARIGVGDVVSFVGTLTCRYQFGTVELAATSLRSFFRFLRAQGLRTDRLEDAVPVAPHRRQVLPRYLDSAAFARLMACLDGSSPRGLRDRAIILCVARLGLRAGEVVGLGLGDIDWRNATVRVRARKTGHGALLPLPRDLGQALSEYLQHGRPDTGVRQVFVLHRLRVGEPISDSIVGRAVQRALRNAGIDPPIGGANLLRHSLATDLLGHGATMEEIADVMGHRSLATTRIYASVDIAALREVALPWPQVTS